MDKIGEPQGNLYLSILLILCLPNISNKFYNGTGEDQSSPQHNINIDEGWLG